jgi:tetratricopeptide (TPR) repeat protein
VTPLAWRFRSVAAGLAVALLSSSAHAEPNLWERARRPKASAESRLLAALERTLDARELSQGEPEVSQHIARAAVAMSDLSGIREPSDPRLRTVIAEALIAARLDREPEARELLESALPELPDGPLRARGYALLADVLAQIDEPRPAIAARTEALRLEYRADARAGSYYNRAEAKLELGQLESAREDYLRAIDLASEPDILALARYGLGVTLERLGDLPSAYQALDAANLVRLPVPPYLANDPLELPGVYFVPAYERHYLEALRAMARARRAANDADRREHLETALAAWDAYLEAAPDDVPYRRNAAAHRKRTLAELERPRRR